MCRLLGVVANTSASMETLLGAQQCSFFLSMSRLHADGWGSAWVADGVARRVERVRDPRAPQGGPAAQEALDVMATPARARLMHLRMATAGLPISVENTHPFLVEGMAFAHNGAIAPKEGIRDLLSEPFRSSIHGDTDSELYFALIRQRTTERGDLVDGVRTAVSELRELSPYASLNALLLTPDTLIAVHASDMSPTPLKEFAASGIADADLPLQHLDAYFQMSYLQLDDGSIALSSSGIDTTGWTRLPAASLGVLDLETLNFRVERVNEQAADSIV